LVDKVYPNALRAGYALHWYTVHKVLGRGGFGITYLALDKNLNRPAAIKEYLPSDLAYRDKTDSINPLDDDNKAEYQWGLSRFLIEAQTLARFEHPYIVRVIAVFEANNTGYMVMPFEEGEELSALLNRRKTLTEAELLPHLFPLLDGLEKVHQQGFIHRDIKPQNIIIRKNGTPVLIDFGSARQALGEKTKTLTSLVTPGYAPFEQYYSKSGKQGPWTDIYALAATLYRCIEGRAPLSAIDRSEAIISGTGDSLQLLGSQDGQGKYSRALLQAITHGLQFKPEDRPQSIREWRRDFKFLERTAKATFRDVKDVPVLDTDALKSKKAPKSTLRKHHVSFAGVSLLIIIVAVLVVIYRGEMDNWLGKIKTSLAGSPAQPTATELWEKEQAIVQSLEAELTKHQDQLHKLKNIDLPEVANFRQKKQEKIKAIEAELAKRHNVLKDIKAKVALEQRTLAEKAKIEQEKKLAEERREKERLQKEQRKQEITSLLDQAKDDLKQSRLIQPEGNNAYFRYQQVLKLDPDNDKARNGIRTVAEQLVMQAETAIQDGQLDKAQALLKGAEKISPDTNKLTATRQLLQLKQEEQQRLATEAEAKKKALEAEQLKQVQAAEQQKQIADLLARAEKDIASLRLTSPADNNALDKYRQVLSLVPDNKVAKRGILEIVDRYILLAKQAAESGAYDMALSRVKLAEDITPGAENIRFVREEIEMAKKKAEEQKLVEEEKRKAEELARINEERHQKEIEEKHQADEKIKQEIIKEKTDLNSQIQSEQQNLQKDIVMTEMQKSMEPQINERKKIIIQYNRLDAEFLRHTGIELNTLDNKIKTLLNDAGYETNINREDLYNTNTLTLVLTFYGTATTTSGFWYWGTGVEVKQGTVTIWSDKYETRIGPHKDVKPAPDKFIGLVNKYISETK